MRRILGFLLMVLCAGMPAMADRQVDQSVNADANGEVSIELLAGKVRVIGWDRNQIEVTGTIGDDVEELTVDRSGDRVEIEVELESTGREKTRTVNHADVDLEIRVPHGSSVELEAISVDFAMEGVDGEIEIEAVSGDVEIRGALRSAEIEMVSGEIEFRGDAALKEADFETVSADVEFHGDFAAGGDYSFESVSGNITIFVSKNASVDFTVETFSGEIDNDFGQRAEKESRYTPGQTLEFSVGGGEASVEINSFSGRIDLRKE